MKNILFIPFLIAAGVLLFNLNAHSADKVDIEIGKAPIVIELYTSQGCSSCPPAEKILGQLAQNRRIFALSCHVTYWDYLGWKDTFAAKACDNRQLGIMKTRGKQNYYTPQMVINGVDEFPGHRSATIKKSIEKANQNPIRPISMSHQNKKTIIASMPYVIGGDYTIWALGYQEPHSVQIKTGENRGRTLASTNTVRMIESVGKWDGQGTMMRFDLAQNEDLDGVVLIAQSNRFGPIIASGRIEF